jgi:hypothetical protein
MTLGHRAAASKKCTAQVGTPTDQAEDRCIVSAVLRATLVVVPLVYVQCASVLSTSGACLLFSLVWNLWSIAVEPGLCCGSHLWTC